MRAQLVWKAFVTLITSSTPIQSSATPRIADGTYPRATRVPSMTQLIEEFGVAAATAHKALLGLRERGLTYTEPGLGSFVK